MHRLSDDLMRNILRRVPERSSLRAVNHGFRRCVDSLKCPGYLLTRRRYFAGLLRFSPHDCVNIDMLVNKWLAHGIIYIGSATMLGVHISADFTTLNVTEVTFECSRGFVRLRDMKHCIGVYRRGVGTCRLPFTHKQLRRKLADIIRFKAIQKGYLYNQLKNVGMGIVVVSMYLTHMAGVLGQLCGDDSGAFAARGLAFDKYEYLDCKRLGTTATLSAQANKHSSDLCEFLYCYPFALCLQCTQPWSSVEEVATRYRIVTSRALSCDHYDAVLRMLQQCTALTTAMSLTCDDRVVRMIHQSPQPFHALLAGTLHDVCDI